MKKAAIFSAHFGRLFSAACVGLAIATTGESVTYSLVLAALSAVLFGVSALVLKSYSGTEAE